MLIEQAQLENYLRMVGTIAEKYNLRKLTLKLDTDVVLHSG